jgi:hypothetical protein
MKTKTNKVNRISVDIARANKAGLTNCLGEMPISRKEKRQIRELTRYFAEDSLICQDYDLNFMSRYSQF